MASANSEAFEAAPPQHPNQDHASGSGVLSLPSSPASSTCSTSSATSSTTLKMKIKHKQTQNTTGKSSGMKLNFYKDGGCDVGMNGNSSGAKRPKKFLSQSAGPSSPASKDGSSSGGFLSMSGGPAGGRLESLLKKVMQEPPSKRLKLNGDLLMTGSTSSPASSHASATPPDDIDDDEGHNHSQHVNSLQQQSTRTSFPPAPSAHCNPNEMATMTDPDNLGPCEPGTAVKLQGVVWQETEKGLLVLDVSWNGKTYMGTLIDCNRQSEDHKWGPPREAPAVSKIRGKRGRTCRARTPPVKNKFKGKHHHHHQKHGIHSNLASPSASASVKNDKRRSFQEACHAIKATNEDGHPISNSTNNSGDESSSHGSANGLIECPKTECGKKFKDLNALKFHLSYAHNELKAKHEAKIKELKDKEEKEKEEREKEKEKEKENEEKEKEEKQKTEEVIEEKSKIVKTEDTKSEAKEPEKQVSHLQLLQQQLQQQPFMNNTGRATAVVKPLVAPTTTASDKSASFNVSTVTSMNKRAASPAYSDISDEESEVKPLALISNSSSAQGKSSQASGNNRGTPSTTQSALNLSLNAPSMSSSGSPSRFGSPYLPPFSPFSTSSAGSSVASSLLPQPPPAHQAMAAAAMAAALASDPRLPRSTSSSVNSPAHALDLLHQHAARQYLASSKLQEFQDQAMSSSLSSSTSSASNYLMSFAQSSASKQQNHSSPSSFPTGSRNLQSPLVSRTTTASPSPHLGFLPPGFSPASMASALSAASLLPTSFPGLQSNPRLPSSMFPSK